MHGGRPPRFGEIWREQAGNHSKKGLPSLGQDMFDGFSPSTRAWLAASFPAPTRAQAEGWPAIASGRHTLIHAPTGSGKTLAAFLFAIDRLLAEPLPDRAERCRVLYVSPLKALAYDIERNLRAPLAGIRNAAESLGELTPPLITAGLRTGDTPSDERQRMMRNPPDILITTPESLYLLLTSQARRILTSVRWVIVDEVHSVAGSKRGAHLAISLERLNLITQVPPQRIGLSATQRPLAVIAGFLGGGEPTQHSWKPRPVNIVDAADPKPLEIEIVVPVDDMTSPPPKITDGGERTRGSMSNAIYPRLLEEVRANRSVLIFANSRRLSERIAGELNRLAGEEIARAHHGSVAREQRIEIEELLKAGKLPAVVATSSLELGIDMGAVDLVVQVEAPLSVASGLQRVGRAGHQVGVASRAKFFPKYRTDLLASAVTVDRMLSGAIEETRVPRQPLDVLAQQLVAMVVDDPRSADDLYQTVRRAAPYAELARGPFDATLDMLAGRYPSDLFAALAPRVVWDRATGMVSARRGARLLAVTNPGTIPDRGLYPVTLPDGTKVGELDEEMVYESRVGDAFLLGSSTWRIAEITPARVEVIPAPTAQAGMPFWHGDHPGRSFELGRAIGELVSELGALPSEGVESRLRTKYRLDRLAAANAVAFLDEQREATGVVPSHRQLVAERFRDELGDWRLVMLSPFGARVHAPWALAVRRRIAQRTGVEPDIVWGDDGMALRFPDSDLAPSASEFIIEPDELAELVEAQLPDSALFAARFREAAARALLLPRRRPGKRTPLWLQRRRAGDLLSVSRAFGDFPITLETFREVLQDDFDLPALHLILSGIHQRSITVTEVETSSPSPFAVSLLFEFVASFMYEGDTPLAERQAAALSLDRRLLAELLGEADLRQLLIPEVIEAVELELQGLVPTHQAEHADELADLLRRLGPLTKEQLEARTRGGNPALLLSQLEADHRIVRVGNQPHFAAIEDIGRLRDALGLPTPLGVPGVFLEPVADPVGDVVGRFARTHGPFTAHRAATDLGLPLGLVEFTLRRLEQADRVSEGAFLAGGGREWVDNDVLRTLKRRSLAHLRHEIEAVSPVRYAAFLVGWHGVGSESSGEAALVGAVRCLQGSAIPASLLETEILPARLEYRPEQLDALLGSGDVMWVGRGSLGTRDGKIALYLRGSFPLLVTPANAPAPDQPLHESIRASLAQAGASFFADLYLSIGGGDPVLALAALWDLVWAGEVSNDSLVPLRAFLKGPARSERRPLASRFPPSSSGRWWLTQDRLKASLTSTERAAAWAHQLLDRYGIVTRAAATSEAIPGGFTSVYPVLSQLEERGQIRRGYFVEGMGGAQFARPGAVDHLRLGQGGGGLLLAAADPANPYGAALPWPVSERMSRSAGAWVVISDGALLAYLDRGARRITTFTHEPEPLRQVASKLADLVHRRRRLEVEEIDGEAAVNTPLGAALGLVGFVESYRGLVLNRRPA